MALNPYASFLSDRDPLVVIAETPSRIQTMTASWDTQSFERAYAPGKWNIRQVLSHLADCETVFAFRLRQTLAEDGHIIQPFDQDHWAKNYAAYDARQALAIYHTLRQWNLALIRSLAPDAWSRTVSHPERGAMTFRTIVETMGGHDLNHFGQVESVARV